MPRNLKLTWQPGSSGRDGRWRKKYRGKVYYFVGGRGKTDREAYQKAITSWERKKTEIDASLPKPNQEAYEREIAKWELVLTWCRKHGDEKMAATATAKLDILRRGLTRQRPKPIAPDDTFDGQFDMSIRFPGHHAIMTEFVQELQKLPCTVELSSDTHPEPSCKECLATSQENLDAMEGISSDATVVMTPPKLPPTPEEQLAEEKLLWEDRIKMLQRSTADKEKTLSAYVERFLNEKRTAVSAGKLSASRAYALGLHLKNFVDWLGSDTAVTEINAEILNSYRLELLERVKSQQDDAKGWSSTTANDYMSSVKTLVQWLYELDVLTSLPRNMHSKSGALRIGKSSSHIVVFSKDEVKKLLVEASDRTRLYILLMLNCGMTQKDIADLQISEIDWKRGRITRKRSKTRRFSAVPEVNYKLWQETFQLLKKERSTSSKGCVLMNTKGQPLWFEEVCNNGKIRKNDNIKSAFHRLQQKTGIHKSLISLKKTSASLIRGSDRFASLENLFLGHSPHSIAEKHYTQLPQALFDQAIEWLRSQYNIPNRKPSTNGRHKKKKKQKAAPSNCGKK